MRICLQDMVFYGFHGVYPEERKLGQRFIVTVNIYTDLSKDSSIRHLEDTLDYTKVYAIVRQIMEEQEFHLLECCANTILDSLFTQFETIIKAVVSIRKPSVPIQGNLAYAEVEMERCR